MKTDTYTKVVLTLTAIGLFANAFRGAPLISEAQAHPTKLDDNHVWIAGWIDGNQHRKFTQYPLPVMAIE